MTKPTVGQTGWGTQLNDHLDTLQPQASLDADVTTAAANPSSALRAHLLATYAPVTGSTVYASADGTARLMKPSGNTASGIIDWEFQSSTGYLFHLRAGAGSATLSSAIGIGTDAGSGGALLVALKNAGPGISIGSHASHTGTTAFSLLALSKTATPIDVQQFSGAKSIVVQQKLGEAFADGVTTNGSTTFTSATANFTGADVGQTLSQSTSRGEGFVIPAGVTIASVTNATTVVMSAAATNANSGGGATGINFVVGGRAVPSSQRLIQFYNSSSQLLVEITPSVINAHTLDAGRNPASGTTDSFYINGASAKHYAYNGSNYNVHEIKSDAFAWRVKHYAAAGKGSESSPVTSIEATISGGTPRIGFLGTAAQAKQTVTGSRGGNAALASLITALSTIGLLTDSSSA